MPNEIIQQRTLSLSRPVELPAALAAMLQQRPEPKRAEPESPEATELVSEFRHQPAAPETVAWNQAREAEWEAAHAPAPRFVHQEADAETRAHNQQRERAWLAELVRLEETLRDLCPSVFRDPPPPLKVGIFADLCDLLRGEFDGVFIGCFFGQWTKRLAYRTVVQAGGPRFDLDGHAAGEVSETERGGRRGKP